MSNELTLIPDGELNQILNSREKVGYPNEQKNIRNREIDSAITLNRYRQLNNEVSTAELVFINCRFNKEVDIGDYQSAGSVTFKTCNFEENVIIRSSRNTKFVSDCEFKKEFTIWIENNTDGTISNLFINNILRIEGNGIRKLSLSNINVGKIIQDQKLIIKTQCQEFEIDNIYFSEFHFLKPAKFEQGLGLKNQYFNPLAELIS